MGLKNDNEFDLEQVDKILPEEVTHFKLGSDKGETDWLHLDFESIQKLQKYLDQVMEKIL